MAFQLYSTRLYETVYIVSRALESVRREKSQLQGVVLASSYRGKESVWKAGGYLVQDGVRVSPKQRAQAFEIAEARLLLD